MPLQRDNDKDHKVRLAIGNGVRTDVWREFLDRFGNIEVREFYASTEGNVGFVNYVGKIGAVGRVNFIHRVRTNVFCCYYILLCETIVLVIFSLYYHVEAVPVHSD